MRAISKKVQKVMDRIVELLGGKESLKLDNAPEAYMPLSVDRTGDNTFALAHYGEQNGDLMADPDMVFWRGPDGRYYPRELPERLHGRFVIRPWWNGRTGSPTCTARRLRPVW